jgi:hydroxypyruvate reductase/glycerate 2-kinase
LVIGHWDLVIHNDHMTRLANDALAIWHAAVDAVRPGDLIPAHVRGDRRVKEAIAKAKRILVVGAGKAGAAMAEAVEAALGEDLDKVTGIVNVPADAVRPLKRIVLHAARPAASNHPTTDGVHGAEQMLALLGSAGREDLAICLISGGGSALLPAPFGVSLEDKQAVTKLLHACGATIHEMNAVRKHLSRVKGGKFAEAFRGKELFSLILSDVVGDPLDVIASGPTAADPSTFADALAVLDRYDLRKKAPPAAIQHLERGVTGQVPETLKALPANVHNVILGNNARALRAATAKAEALGYRVLNLGSFVEGETRTVAVAIAGIVRSIRTDGLPVAAPACVLIGGETTVTLGPDSGKGGRNQEFVLAVLNKLGADGMRGVAVLSGGTDGEDGPTAAAGAVADEGTWRALRECGLDVPRHLDRHDAYPLFDAVGGLIRTGLTQTNVMDVRVVVVR